MKIRSLISCITTFRFTHAVIISWLLLIGMPAQAHDSCPADDPTPDHPETHPHCNPDKPGGNGNGGTGNPEEILGTEFDDGGGPDSSDPPGCVDATLTTAVDGNPGTSDDILKGLAGNDCLVGIEIVPGSPLPDPGDDWGNDRFDAGSGNDWMLGGNGNDVFSAGQGYDVMLGNGGDDAFFAAGDADYVDGGGGWDIVNFNVNGSQLRVNWDSVDHPIAPAPAVVKKCDSLVAAEQNEPYAANTITDVIDPDNPIVDSVFRVEDMHGTPNDDIIFGSDADEASSPHRGDDCIDLGGGDDHLFGDRGNDVLIGGPGSDIMRGGEHKDQFHFYLADFLVGGEEDVIEEFSLRQDCIELNGMVEMGFTSFSYADVDGGDDLDTIIKINPDPDPVGDLDGSILLWDVHLEASDLGCPGP